MTDAVRILGPDGRPMERPRQRASIMLGGGRTPYDAADTTSSHLSDWNPWLGSPDTDLNMYRDRIVSRVRDLVRNDGWASGTVTRVLDNVIGANFRPISKPDYQALRIATGIKGFDHKWADEYGQALDAEWRNWANDPNKYANLERNLSFTQMMWVGFRHKIVDGDAIAILHWRPERVGPGRARFATTVQMVDPDRLSNPQLRWDMHNLRGGVEIDDDGAAIGYHFRKAHQGDWFAGAKTMSWERIPRETSWGRPIVVHDFDHERAGQHRGGAGILAPVVSRFKMLAKYDSAELDAAIINAIFAAYIESPFDPQLVEQALVGEEENALSEYQDQRAEFHKDRRMSLGGARIPTLFPGEKITAVQAARPSANFGMFEGAVLRNIASATGTTTQQVSGNYADVNYSSHRGALLEAWKTFGRRRSDFAFGFGLPIYGGFVEEAHDIAALPMPKGAPPFLEYRAAYARARFMGPGKGMVDPIKERQGAVLGMDAGLSTLEDECADLGGADWRENLAQRAIEVDRFKELGLTPPDWTGGMTATEVSQPPEAQ